MKKAALLPFSPLQACFRASGGCRSISSSAALLVDHTIVSAPAGLYRRGGVAAKRFSSEFTGLARTTFCLRLHCGGYTQQLDSLYSQKSTNDPLVLRYCCNRHRLLRLVLSLPGKQNNCKRIFSCLVLLPPLFLPLPSEPSLSRTRPLPSMSVENKNPSKISSVQRLRETHTYVHPS